MIEQTEMIVTEWDYHPPSKDLDKEGRNLSSSLSMDVMRKRAANKKGVAFQFSTCFTYGDEMILHYVAEDSYVIDLADKVDRWELLRMIRNSYSKFQEKFDFRKPATVLWDVPLAGLDESRIDLDAILVLLE